MIPVSTPEEADLFPLNTWSGREIAAQKVYSRLATLKERKRKQDNFRIGVVGCVAQHEGERMLKKASILNLVVGTHLYQSMVDLLDELDSKDSDQDPSRRVRTRLYGGLHTCRDRTGFALQPVRSPDHHHGGLQ